MDGKNFFRGTVTPPPIPQFMFDLQRFTPNYTDSGDATKGYLYDETEAAGYDSASGAYFKVSSDGGNTNVKYFKNINAAINYVYSADSSGTTDSALYKSNDTYTATITLLQNVTDGLPIKLVGGKIKKDGTNKVGPNGSIPTDASTKTNLTIDLGGYTYNFSSSYDDDDGIKSRAPNRL